MAAKFLVVGAEQDVEAYVAGLRATGFTLSFARSLAEAVRAVMAERPDGVLVAVEPSAAPDACEVVRALGDMPMMAAGNALSADVAARCLDAGADAVIGQTNSTAELAARLGVILRRAARQAPPAGGRIVSAGDLRIDLDERAVTRSGAAVRLSPTEFKVLAVLAEHPGRVVTNGEILSRVWGPEFRDDIHYVRLYIGYLRQKLTPDPSHPALIVNQWGVGYRLVVSGEADGWSEVTPSAHPAAMPRP